MLITAKDLYSMILWNNLAYKCPNSAMSQSYNGFIMWAYIHKIYNVLLPFVIGLYDPSLEIIKWAYLFRDCGHKTPFRFYNVMPIF